MFSIRNWWKKRNLASIPHLLAWQNNGVVALVRKEDYETVPTRGWPVVVPNTMTFSDKILSSDLVTGTKADLDRLIEGCRVMWGSGPFGPYVPRTSGMLSVERDLELFPVIPLEQASQLIWQGFRKPKAKAA